MDEGGNGKERREETGEARGLTGSALGKEKDAALEEMGCG